MGVVKGKSPPPSLLAFALLMMPLQLVTTGGWIAGNLNAGDGVFGSSLARGGPSLLVILLAGPMLVVVIWAVRSNGRLPAFMIAMNLGAGGLAALLVSRALVEGWWSGLWLELGAALFLAAVLDVVLELRGMYIPTNDRPGGGT